MRSLLVPFLACLLAACGGGAADQHASAPPPPPAKRPALKPAPKDTLARRDVVAVVEAGFGRFLTFVDVEPSLDQGEFKGWTIVSLRPADFWAGVDLKPGDVVTAVNGLAIERDVEAFDAFQSLRGAPTLSVSYLRAGKPRSLTYRIVDAAPVAAR